MDITPPTVNHAPVLLDKVLELLDIQENDIVVDGTLGLGGHAKSILMKLGPKGRLVGFDLDNRNLQEARRRLRRFEGRVFYLNDSYDKIDHYLKVLKFGNYNKVILDLGVSSPHFDIAEYGFSYMNQGPLDMRYSKDNKITASIILNRLPEEKLTEIFYNFGELTGAKKLAKLIIQERENGPFVYTTDLVTRIESFLPKNQKERHKRLAMIFQALRIAVNDELNVLYKGLRKLFKYLAKNGKFAVISYHSLEDRMVKQFFNELLKPLETDPEKSRRSIHGDPLCTILTKKVLEPTKPEIDANPRSRSAKLRVIQKL